jgi:hypothetical protein
LEAGTTDLLVCRERLGAWVVAMASVPPVQFGRHAERDHLDYTIVKR